MVEMGVIRSLRALPMPPKSTPTPKFAALFGAQLKAQEAAPASGVVGGQGHAKSTTFCYKSTRTPKIFAPAAGCGRLRREVLLASAGPLRPSWRRVRMRIQAPLGKSGCMPVCTDRKRTTRVVRQWVCGRAFGKQSFSLGGAVQDFAGRTAARRPLASKRELQTVDPEHPLVHSLCVI